MADEIAGQGTAPAAAGAPMATTVSGVPKEPGQRTAIGLLSALAPLVVLAAAQMAGPSSCDKAHDDGLVHITLLQMNDVYEIAPLEGDDAGGLARVAALRQELLADNPNTYTMLAGDFLSPSAMGTVQVDGAALDGRQMVDMLRATGVDFATLGNHEFDLKRGPLEQRLGEAGPALPHSGGFAWLSANVRRTDGSAFPGVQGTTVFEVPNPGGAPVRVGVLGLTVETRKCGDYVTYESPLQAAQREVPALRPRVDVLIAMTHLSLAQDKEIAAKVPGIDLILGGHEHVRQYEPAAPGRPPIAKADANARTVFVHRLAWDPAQHKVSTTSKLRAIGPWQPSDAAVAGKAAEWQRKVDASLAASGVPVHDVVTTRAPALDGDEEDVRSGPTNLTTLIADGMLAAGVEHARAKGLPTAELALFNSGSIRVDATLPAGNLTQWDVYRILPYPGQLRLVRIQGSALTTILDGNAARRLSGEFLQTAGIGGSAGHWTVGASALDPARAYVAVVNDYLLRAPSATCPSSIPGLDHLPVVANDFKDVRQSLVEALRRL